VFFGARKTKVVAPITLVTAAVKIALTFVLVPALGVLGAAVATLVGYAGTALLSGLVAGKLLPVPYHAGYLAKCAAASAVMAGFLWLVSPASPHGVIAAALGAVVVYFAALFALRGFTRADLVAARGFVARLWRRA
jgi:O-antigen/teichoic acid export membrane protein